MPCRPYGPGVTGEQESAVRSDSAPSNRRRAIGLLAAVAAAIPATVAVFAAPAGAAASVTVAADGSGNYRTVQAAIDAVPTNNASRFTINIKKGTYREMVTVPANKPFVTLAGLGARAQDVLIVNNHSAGTKKSDGSTYGTFNSASVFVHGHDFAASNLTIANDFVETAGASNQQAVALHITADRAVLGAVRLLGNQDTLLVNKPARIYLHDSYVEGDVDFIFGGGVAVLAASEIHTLSRGSTSNNGAVTAASTPTGQAYGFLFTGCTLTSNAPAKSVYLGRPWHPSSNPDTKPQVIVRNSSLGAHIRSDPWTDMSGYSWKDARFFEYANTGAGAGVNANRPQLTASAAAAYTPQRFLAGSDGWNPAG